MLWLRYVYDTPLVLTYRKSHDQEITLYNQCETYKSHYPLPPIQFGFPRLFLFVFVWFL